MGDRFLTWVYYSHGLHAYDAARMLSVAERGALLTKWIALGCPYPIGV